MNVVGYIATGVVALIGLIGVGILISVIPDIRRYARIRKM